MHQVNEDLFQLPNGYVIERGPVRREDVATEELLTSGKLAPHYRVGARDAMGKPIVIGDKFTYVDWNSPKDSWPWKVYKNTPYKNDKGEEVPFMEQVGEFEIFALAVGFCQ